MTKQSIEERLNDLEMYLTNIEKVIDDLNTEVLRQGKIIERLSRQNKALMSAMKDSAVKPLSEETRPPHY